MRYVYTLFHTFKPIETVMVAVNQMGQRGIRLMGINQFHDDQHGDGVTFMLEEQHSVQYQDGTLMICPVCLGHKHLLDQKCKRCDGHGDVEL